MEFIATELPGCFQIKPTVIRDSRGHFLKNFVASEFESHGISCHFVEGYDSESMPGVLRGMHFQTPPAAHAKLVYCSRGRVQDIVLDMRMGSPTYGKHLSFILNGDSKVMIYIPAGLSHGFLALERSTMHYKVTSEYSAECEGGIAWDSFGCKWMMEPKIISERDKMHPKFAEFITPFCI